MTWKDSIKRKFMGLSDLRSDFLVVRRCGTKTQKDKGQCWKEMDTQQPDCNETLLDT
jgi:hypothetical protein